MTKFLGNLIRWFCILILFLFVIALCFLKAHGSTGKKVGAGDPALAYTVNRHEYSLGTIAGVTVIHLPGGKIWTSVTWKPAMTPLLYDENLLFCGHREQIGSSSSETQADRAVRRTIRN